MSGPRCLLTGGTGFLGRHVAPVLSEMGYDLTILAPDRSPDHPSLIADITHPGLTLPSDGFDSVCHMAGLAHVTLPDADSGARFRQVNVDGTAHLLCALEASRLPESLVFISTVAVYGRESDELLDEDTPREAADPYGRSKRDAEDLIAAWCAANQVRCAILRLPLIAGRRPPGNLGALLRALKNGRYFGIGAGAARRSMVWAEDVARVIPEAARVGGVFHLTDGIHPSYAELEAALCAAMGIRCPRRLPTAVAGAGAGIADAIERLFRRPMPLNRRVLKKMTSTLTFADERARRDLGWNPCSVLSRASELVA